MAPDSALLRGKGDGFAPEYPSHPDPTVSVELYWIPLGCGQHVVQTSGRAYERLVATLHHRPAYDLYHSALVLRVSERQTTIEMTPIPKSKAERGVVVEGPVGARCLGHWRTFRYEIRRWPGGSIPDLSWAIDSPRALSIEPGKAQRIFELVPSVPALTWGRAPDHQGDMWNSNSVVSWLLQSSGFDATAIQPPSNGRAPGWDAGIRVALKANVKSATAH